MRFVSKSANLMLVLKQGISGNPLTQTPAVNGTYVKFQSGAVDVKEESIIELMYKHPGFNVDFILADEEEKDPYEYLRNETEPAHILTEIKYGHAEKSVGTQKKRVMPPEIMEMINNQAAEIAKAMLPDMVKSVLESMGKSEVKTPETLVNVPTNTPTQFCGMCASKGVRHLKDCPTLKKEDPSSIILNNEDAGDDEKTS